MRMTPSQSFSRPPSGARRTPKKSKPGFNLLVLYNWSPAGSRRGFKIISINEVSKILADSTHTQTQILPFPRYPTLIYVSLAIKINIIKKY